ncbi:Uncharacterised protein [Clostridium perfringens]|nr:hypothetical protein [Clostridium perfringens]STB42097.1 Uncharacterised protein [Clostridium perfringens]
MDYSKIIFTITYSFIIITQLNFLIRIIFKLYTIKGVLFNLTDEFIIDKDIQNRKLNSAYFLFIMFIIASMNIIRYELKKI